MPLHLVVPADDEVKPKEVEQRGTARSKRKRTALGPSAKKRESIGEVLSRVQRLAVLGLPGGGKSTLLKRLAIAYAFPDRRKLIHDELPERNWLPLFIRCRQLESQVRSPLTEILGDVRKRAEIGPNLAESFAELVIRSLHSGAALLLVDGLDEISDEGDRLAFVQQLRTFLAIYPAVAVVMTCRDAGFRNIAGAISGHCTQLRLADFNNADIRRLTVAWHKEVVGSREDVIAEAEKLADTICRTDRVRRLAQNPLLLTALLLVKRWVGQMPTKRSVLYGKAVEVLLMTWNVEGHEPIDPEEALPQLEFVAYTMMKEGSQRISVRRLREILSTARLQMPEILGYTKVSVQEFIQQVELRSSLLILSGFGIEEGTLYPMYEFRHLTFQEYLTAKAISNGHYPDRKDSDTALDLLKPHLQDENWEEVLLLSAVLAGRKVLPLVQHLIAEVQEQQLYPGRVGRGQMSPASLLAKCIIDEIQVPPDVLRQALKWVSRRNEEESLQIQIFRGKYGSLFVEVCFEEIQASDSDLLNVGSTIACIAAERLGWPTCQVPLIMAGLKALLEDSNPLKVTEGCLAVTQLALEVARPNKTKGVPSDLIAALPDLFQRIGPFVRSDVRPLALGAIWALVWLLRAKKSLRESGLSAFGDLLDSWMKWKVPELRYLAAWGIASLPITDRGSPPFSLSADELLEFIRSKEDGTSEERIPLRWQLIEEFKAALILAFYVRAPWQDDELAQLIATHIDRGENRDQLLQALGAPGMAQLEKLSLTEKAIRRATEAP